MMANQGHTGTKVNEGMFNAIHDLHRAGRNVPTISKMLNKAKRTVKIAVQYPTYAEYRVNGKILSVSNPKLDERIMVMENRTLVIETKLRSVERKMSIMIAHLDRKIQATISAVKDEPTTPGDSDGK